MSRNSLRPSGFFFLSPSPNLNLRSFHLLTHDIWAKQAPSPSRCLRERAESVTSCFPWTSRATERRVCGSSARGLSAPRAMHEGGLVVHIFFSFFISLSFFLLVVVVVGVCGLWENVVFFLCVYFHVCRDVCILATRFWEDDFDGDFWQLRQAGAV